MAKKKRKRSVALGAEAGGGGGAKKKPRKRYPSDNKWRKRCPHGKIKNGYMCKECGGKGLCKKHGRNRSRCVDCDGKKQAPSKRCPHGKVNNGYHCLECPGKGICKHDRRRSRCVDCGGKKYKEAPHKRCPHGKGKNGYFCEDCGGKGLCKHGLQHAHCEDCACPICLKGFAPLSRTVLPCGHDPCTKCWTLWTATQATKHLDATCPSCNRVIIAAA